MSEERLPWGTYLGPVLFWPGLAVLWGELRAGTLGFHLAPGSIGQGVLLLLGVTMLTGGWGLSCHALWRTYLTRSSRFVRVVALASIALPVSGVLALLVTFQSEMHPGGDQSVPELLDAVWFSAGLVGTFWPPLAALCGAVAAGLEAAVRPKPASSAQGGRTTMQ